MNKNRAELILDIIRGRLAQWQAGADQAEKTEIMNAHNYKTMVAEYTKLLNLCQRVPNDP